MSRQPNKTLIGAFVLGAIALVVVAVTIFGSGKLFQDTQLYTLYFDGSVTGLNNGSPVVFHGVKIGNVKDIRLHVDLKKYNFQIPVIVEIDPSRMNLLQGTPDKEKALEQLIAKGLRGQLQMQSFVTGQLMVGLEFFPDTPAKMVSGDSPYPEIPTVASPLEQLSATIEKLPVEKLFNKLTEAVSGIEEIINSPQAKQTMAALSGFMEKANSRLDPLSLSAEQTMSEIRLAAQNINEALVPMINEAQHTAGDFGDLARRFSAVADNVDLTLAEARTALAQGSVTLKEAENTISEDAPVMVEFKSTLREWAAMSRSIRQLSELLKRHPEALIRGKGDQSGGQ